MSLTGVMGVLCCAHEPVNADIFGGELHGHTYEVWAWFENPDGTADMRVFKAALETVLKLWDHKVLPAEISTMEAIAKAVCTLAKCRKAQVYRRLEGFAAEWGRE